MSASSPPTRRRKRPRASTMPMTRSRGTGTGCGAVGAGSGVFIAHPAGCGSSFGGFGLLVRHRVRPVRDHEVVVVAPHPEGVDADHHISFPHLFGGVTQFQLHGETEWGF